MICRSKGKAVLKLYEIFNLATVRELASKTRSQSGSGPAGDETPGPGAPDPMAAMLGGAAQGQNQGQQMGGGFQQMGAGMGAPMMGAFGGQPATECSGCTASGNSIPR